MNGELTESNLLCNITTVLSPEPVPKNMCVAGATLQVLGKRELQILGRERIRKKPPHLAL
jgi:hypothetical protein